MSMYRASIRIVKVKVEVKKRNVVVSWKERKGPNDGRLGHV